MWARHDGSANLARLRPVANAFACARQQFRGPTAAMGLFSTANLRSCAGRLPDALDILRLV